MNTPANKLQHVVIVGGGITGLSTAWYLMKQARENAINLHVTLFEASERFGGKIHTDTIDGYGDAPFIIEAGPDSFLTQKPWALQLIRDLGLEDRLLNTNDHLRKIFVLKRGKMIPLPDGVQLIVPTRLMPFALSPLISPLAKLRMGLDLIIPAKRDAQDETIAEFIRRRLGSEALDRIAEPLMSGIYNAEAEKQSLLATFPRFRVLEQEHGSLIKGMLAAQKAAASLPDKPRQKPAMFTSLIDGTQELVDALVRQLRADPCVQLVTSRIERIDHVSGEQQPFRLPLTDQLTSTSDVVVLTTPSGTAADLVQRLAPEAAAGLSQIRYVSTGTISLAYMREDIQHPLNGFGVVIPRSENRLINAITWVSTKFDHRAPNGYALLRVFFGGSRRPEIMAKSDTELTQIARSELEALMGITAEPVFERIYRWQDATPQYDKGHLELVDRIEAALPDDLYVAGSPYRGIGIPDCVHQAQQTAEKIMTRLQHRTITE